MHSWQFWILEGNHFGILIYSAICREWHFFEKFAFWWILSQYDSQFEWVLRKLRAGFRFVLFGVFVFYFQSHLFYFNISKKNPTRSNLCTVLIYYRKISVVRYNRINNNSNRLITCTIEDIKTCILHCDNIAVP